MFSKVNKAVRDVYYTIDNKTGAITTTVATGFAVASPSTFAALPTEVSTSITAAQTDILAMIGLGFAYTGAVVGLMVVLGVFIKILRKGRG